MEIIKQVKLKIQLKRSIEKDLISLARNHNYPIWYQKLKNLLLIKIYAPNVIKKGLRFFVQTKADFIRYDDQNFQNLYTLFEQVQNLL